MKEFLYYNLTAKLHSVKRLFSFMWTNKIWWMMPLVAALMLFGFVIILGHSTPLGPFIYTIF